MESIAALEVALTDIVILAAICDTLNFGNYSV